MKAHDEGRDPLHAFAEEHDRVSDEYVPAMAASSTMPPDHNEQDVGELHMLNYVVARQMKMSEVEHTPAAKAAMASK